jgi:D-glycero-D-manno-heptose 1,7-bisphosphate phosphatase
MKKALFLDRDGVINKDFGYVHKVEDLEYIDGIFDLCSKAISLGYIIIVITNQSGIARGIFSEKDFIFFMKKILNDFNAKGITIKDFYYCPYHMDAKIKKYKKDSYLRKPNPGMILDAVKKNHIDIKKSIMIGDKLSDMQAAIKAGIAKNLLLTNSHPSNGDNENFNIIYNLRDYKNIF